MSDPAPSVPPAARASLVVAKPASVVRAQFFDVAHAIDRQIYHGVELSWSGGDDEAPRRVRRAMRVMDRAIVDDVVVEHGEGGAWVMRFVDGQNAGARFVARFANEDEERTRVDLEAFAPPQGFTFGLGKLSSIGLEKALRKMLAEHQTALEGYDPKDRRSWVARALGEMAELTAGVAKLGEREQRALVATLLEAASAVAVADDHADADEEAVLEEVARALVKVDMDEDGRARLVKSAQAALAKDGMAARCDGLGRRLATLGCAELGLSIAALVAEASHGIDPPELAALERMAQAAKVPEAGLRSILERVDEGLESVRPISLPSPVAARPKPPPLPPGARKKA